MSRIEEIKARCEAATPGPWEADYNTPFSNDFVGIYEETEGYIIKAEDEDEGDSTRPNDAAFIANAREDIPYLLAEVKQLKAGLNMAINHQKTLQDLWNRETATLTARAEKAETERNTYKEALQNWHEPKEGE